MKRILFSLALFFLVPSLKAQDWKRAQNWYFGDSAGLSFATDPPTTLTDGAMYAMEGCATISDTAGNLLFYTNGKIIWNKNHQVMLNGTGLFGAESSAQAALIVPQPGNDSIYFVFTTGNKDAISPKALRYTTVNINRDNGKGEVIEKNIVLVFSQTEKLAATHHANGHDVWVATHGFNNNHFYAFLITEYGIISCPIISEVGSIMGPSPASIQGQMKFSSSGNLVAVSFFNLNFSELLQFDNSHGTFENPIKITSGSDYPLSAEFSPSEKFLYITERDERIAQYDISLYDDQFINDSRLEIYFSTSMRTLQQSLNGEILASFQGSGQIGAIEEPDSSGIFCSFIAGKYSLSPKVSTFSLPNFISSYFKRIRVNFKYEAHCSGTFQFTSFDTIQANNFKWKFIKDNQIIDLLTGSSVAYSFPDTGSWKVRLIVSSGTELDSVLKDIFIYQTGNDLGTDTIICADSFLLDAGPGHCYMWSDSSSGRYLNVHKSGIYTVKIVTNDFCILYDTITVTLDKHTVAVPISRSGDTLYTNSGFKNYQWYRNGTLLAGNTSSKLILNENGIYKVLATNQSNCFGFSAELVVDTLTSVGQEFSLRNLVIYPNPSSTSQGVFISSDGLIKSMQLYSTDGKLIQSNNKISDYRFHLRDISVGTYFLTINNLYNFKIIIN